MTYQEDESAPKASEEVLADEVLRADDARYEAMVNGDLAALDLLLSPELTYTHSSAHCESKKEYMASLSGGRVRYQATQRDEVSVRIRGEAAILEGHVVLLATVDGVPRRLDNRFLSVWLRRDHSWQMLAWASTPLPDVPKEGAKDAD
ncbi:nuclear transport factor 2 family protein [Variovorax sp. WS11]|nr:nuclear transport factor 2 family protein [Variovorax sp. WS11]PSL86140.1 nuclear transport factor 2 family protein [Variovorax sp. WS11]